jgi:hypothetical protein
MAKGSRVVMSGGVDEGVCCDQQISITDVTENATMAK